MLRLDENALSRAILEIMRARRVLGGNENSMAEIFKIS
jgi:hypothetical protein